MTARLWRIALFTCGISETASARNSGLQRGGLERVLVVNDRGPRLAHGHVIEVGSTVTTEHHGPAVFPTVLVIFAPPRPPAVPRSILGPSVGHGTLGNSENALNQREYLPVQRGCPLPRHCCRRVRRMSWSVSRMQVTQKAAAPGCASPSVWGGDRIAALVSGAALSGASHCTDNDGCGYLVAACCRRCWGAGVGVVGADYVAVACQPVRP